MLPHLQALLPDQIINYVITDPKMEVLTATGGYLKQKGFDLRVLNLVNLEQSDGYNPFRYLRDEKDALRLVNNLIQATTPKGSHESDPFWTKSETALLQAIILMLFQEAPEQEQNFSMVMRVLEYAEVKEEDEEYVSPLDLLFNAIERENPTSVAVRQYKVFKMAAGKTAKSTATARIPWFSNQSSCCPCVSSSSAPASCPPKRNPSSTDAPHRCTGIISKAGIRARCRLCRISTRS